MKSLTIILLSLIIIIATPTIMLMCTYEVQWVLTFFMFLIDFITYSQMFYEQLDEEYMMAHSQVHLQE